MIGYSGGTGRLGRGVLCAWLLILAGGFSPAAGGTPEAGMPAAVGGDTFHPPLGTYTYWVSWEGIKAAKAEVTVGRDGEYFRITAKAKTRKVIDKMYKIRYGGQGVLNAADLSPVKTVLDSREGKRKKKTEITYKDGGEIETVETKKKKGKATKVKVRTFQPEGQVLDPFAAVFLARSLPWEVGARHPFEVFSGKEIFLVTLTCTAKTQVKIAGKKRDAWKIVPEVKNLSKPDDESKLESVTLYLSADDQKDILKIDSKVFIGSVRAELEEFEPARAP